MVVILQILDESITYTDSLLHGYITDVSFSESYSISDIFAKNINKTLLDTTNFTDTVLFPLVLTELLDFVDDIPSVHYVKVLSELWSFIDKAYRHPTKYLSDNTSLHDILVYGKFIVELLENCVVGDITKRAIAKLLSDNHYVGAGAKEEILMVDDFEDADVTDWVFEDGTWSATSNAAYSGNYGLEVTSGYGAFGYKQCEEPFNTSFLTLSGYTCLLDEYYVSGFAIYTGLDNNTELPNGGYILVLNSDENTVAIYRLDYSDDGLYPILLDQISYTIEPNVWYKATITIKPDGTIEGYIDDTIVISATDTTYTTFNCVGTYVKGTVYFDNIKAYLAPSLGRLQLPMIISKHINEVSHIVDEQPSKAILKYITETNYFLDICIKCWPILIVDTIQFTDFVAKSLLKRITNVLTIADKRYSGIMQNILEQLIASDILSKLPYKIFTDATYLLDVRDNIKLLFETTQASDSIAKQIYQIMSESVLYGDLLAKNISKLLVELQDFGDIITKSMRKPYVESISVTDVYNNITHKLQMEAIALTDSFIRTVRYIVQEYLSYDDLIAKSHYMAIKETIAYLDTVSNYNYLQLKDSINYIDNIFRNLKSVLTEYLIVQDAPIRSPVMTLRETLSYLDENVFGWILTEVASFKDTFSKTALFKYLKNKATSLVSKLTKSYPR